MHIGENFNFSYFSKESVLKAIPTLANTPILAYIEKDDTDVDGFSDHRREYKDGKFAYKGAAIGIIPENNNARFEFREDDEGIEREYLIVDGLVWTKWNTPLEIFDRNEGQVPQSMELHDDCTGYTDEKTGLFHFENFKFYGACALGRDVPPAMAGANINMDFTMEEFNKEVQSKMEEFKNFQLKIKEDEELDKKLDILKKFSKTKEELTDIDLETISEDELETKLTEMAKTEEDKKKEAEAKKKKDEEDKKKEEEDKKKFESLESEIESIKEEKVELEKEVEDLREFKQNTLTEKRKADEEELFSKYATLDTVKEFESIKEKSADFECISDLEKEIALIFARETMNVNKNRDFSKKEDDKEDDNKFEFQKEDEKEVRYGGLLEK